MVNHLFGEDSMAKQAEFSEGSRPRTTESRGRIDMGEVAFLALGAAAGMAIFEAPIAATIAAGIIGPLAFESLRAIRRRGTRAK
jgi:hypothetical protein